ncbi:NTP-binding protein [Chromobacterium phragmitis]|uniref:NTP-binding protein n=1 Tax=Chromobacterium phragmitis TaxID=2202141 RepID=A0A344UIH3_9NEIS|nr:STAS domain-containing protein [Chromobacterium phragmitis]AXE29680.1 NTP-binding protein [Chromobacterium phragmitis]AXE35071.1 NTP-binding protein [Chromobacterium phragmitis]
MLNVTAPGAASLAGRVDMASCAGLVRPLTQLAAQGPLRLDLSGITSADSAALALLLSARRAAEGAGHALTLSGMPAGLATLAGLYDLEPLLRAGD